MLSRLLFVFISASALIVGQAPTPKKKAPFSEIPTKSAATDPDKDIKLGVDEPGCKDSALLPRIAGCSIIQCDTKDDAQDVRIMGAATAEAPAQEELIDGDAEIIYYLCPAKTGVASIVKQSETALSKAGFKVLFNGKDNEEFPLLSTQKDDQYVQISTYNYNELSAYIQTAVKASPDSAASVEAMFDEFVKNGRAVLSGLTFEGDQLTAESDKILAEVAMFLVRQPALKVQVQGHMDGRGDKAALLESSKKRATAVGVWLTEHGVESARVTTSGLGDSQPLGDNNTDEGRAKNRRVELVKVP